MTNETFDGRIVAIEAIGSGSVQVDLVSDAGRSQRVLVAAPAPGLRQGRLVRASGRIDANGILVATSLTPVPAPGRPRWLVAAGVAVVVLAAAAAAVGWLALRGEPPTANYRVHYATERTNLCHVAPGPSPDTVTLQCTFDGSDSHAADASGVVTAWLWTYRVNGPEASHDASEAVTTLPMSCDTLRGAPLQDVNGLHYVEMHVALRVRDDGGRVSEPFDLGPVNLVTHQTCGYAF